MPAAEKELRLQQQQQQQQVGEMRMVVRVREEETQSEISQQQQRQQLGGCFDFDENAPEYYPSTCCEFLHVQSALYLASFIQVSILQCTGLICKSLMYIVLCILFYN
jgi:hypothetical protein